MMKRLATGIVLSVALQGCQHGSLASNDSSGDMRTTPPFSMFKSSTEHWLEMRHQLCRLPVTEQASRLQGLTGGKRPASREARIERLLLASCRPEMTPGLLREALHDISSSDDWSDTELHFIELIRDFEASYLLLEKKNKQLKNELEETIDGIREIETDIDNLRHNGAAP